MIDRRILVLGLAWVLVIAGLPFLLEPYGLSVAITLCMWVALTQSWVVFSGLTGYISLGHVVFVGIGAYVAVLTWKILPLWASLIAGGCVASLFAILIALPVLRVRGPYFVVLTFGIAELVRHIVLNLEHALGASSRLLMGLPDNAVLFRWMAIFALIATALTLIVKPSRFGAGLNAIREDETAAETIGVPAVRYKALAYGLSAFVPGMVGGILVLRSTYFEVGQVFNPMISLSIIVMAIIGGSDDARGPLLGAAFLTLVQELLWARAPQLYLVLLGILLIGFVMFAPKGLLGLWARWKAHRP